MSGPLVETQDLILIHNFKGGLDLPHSGHSNVNQMAIILRETVRGLYSTQYIQYSIIA